MLTTESQDAKKQEGKAAGATGWIVKPFKAGAASRGGKEGAGMNDNHRQLFEEEAQELLAELENQLLELEQAPDDKELIGSIFRAMHTIKGSGAMFGFDDIAAFTHEVESVYDKVRDGQIPVTKELINLTLRARDLIKLMLDGLPEGEAGKGLTSSEIIAGLKGLAPGGGVRRP